MELEDIPDWILQMRVSNYPLNDVIREEIERRYLELKNHKQDYWIEDEVGGRK
jgi:hypothetical protein